MLQVASWDPEARAAHANAWRKVEDECREGMKMMTSGNDKYVYSICLRTCAL